MSVNSSTQQDSFDSLPDLVPSLSANAPAQTRHGSSWRPPAPSPTTSISPLSFGTQSSLQAAPGNGWQLSSMARAELPGRINSRKRQTLRPSIPCDKPTNQFRPSTTPKSQTSRVQKDVDDPSDSMVEDSSWADRNGSSPTTLSRLFTEPEVTSPTVSRQDSYVRFPRGTQHAKASRPGALSLLDHLTQRGFLEGRHSDIIVVAFGTKYALHRLLLDRVPFFATALSEPWLESSAKEINLYPEDTDSNITKAAFELAIKRIYGGHDYELEERETLGLFATANWLEMADLIETSTESILRQMNHLRLPEIIQFFSSSFYGKCGELILESAKTMLCRDGFDMPLRYWDALPSDLIQEILAADCFYIPSEWDRWSLARQILDRRLNGIQSMIPGNDEHGIHPENLCNELYTSPNITDLLHLLENGIHYMHLSFEQLQKVRKARDILGRPFVSERILSNALWQSMELRQKTQSAGAHDLDLGLVQRSGAVPLKLRYDLADKIMKREPEQPRRKHGHIADFPTDFGKLGGSQRIRIANNVSLKGFSSTGKATDNPIKQESFQDSKIEKDEPNDDDSGPRRFWIPETDVIYSMGGTLDTIISAYNGVPSESPLLQLRPPSREADDLIFGSWSGNIPGSRPRVQSDAKRPTQQPECILTNQPTLPTTYTSQAPFRFSVEFPNPRTIKLKKRLYSPPVWYAGSFWNLYIRRKETTKGMELGVYLHRQPYPGTNSPTNNRMLDTVDSRISNLERELLRRLRRAGTGTYDTEDNETDDGIPDSVDPMESLPTRGMRYRSSLTHDRASEALRPVPLHKNSSASNSDTHTRALDLDDETTTANTRASQTLTLPPYTDKRPTIMTYSRIYTPNKSGRLLSVYESVPVKMDFGRSWGWRSGGLVLDDGVGEPSDTLGPGPGDGKVRFIVVLGVL